MAPTLQQFNEDSNDELRRYEYDDGVTYAADIGAAATVDVVDGTVLVVAGDEQAEFELAESGPTEATVNNGVLTVEVER